MKREEKIEAVEELTSSLGEAEAIFAVNYRGISVGQAAELRGRLREADAVFKVVKNRLAKRATAGAGAEVIDEHLVGPTALTLVHGDAVIAAKAISSFSRENDVLEFKGGLMDGQVLDPDGFAAIARLPGLDVLRGQLVGVAASPITGLARGLGSMLSGLAVALGQIADQGLVTGEPEAGASDEVAEDAAEPAATPEPEPADTGAEGEDVGGESAAEPEPADTGAEGEDVQAGAGDEVADRAAEAVAETASEPAAPAAPEPGESEGEAEDVGGGIDKEE